MNRMQLSANQTLRYVTGVFAVLCFALSARAEDTSDAMAVLSIVNQRCVECHGSDAQEGDVRFDKLTGSPHEEPVWASILEQLEIGEMPPQDEPVGSKKSNEHLGR